MKAAVLCAGPIERSPELVEQIAACDLLICADGGYRTACDLGLVPDLLIGDFDSYCGVLPNGIEILRLPREKDETDSYVCAQEAIRRGCNELLLPGTLGGRLDHTVANLQMLVRLRRLGVAAEATDGRHTAFVLYNETKKLTRRSDTKVSIFSLSERSVGVCLRGLKYPLCEAELTSDFALGVSNEFAEETAEITVRKGTLLVILAYDPAEA